EHGRARDSTFNQRLRAFVVVRSRFAEDTLRAATDQGVRQYVVLGAGLDTFAYRNPRADVRVFEVDHPDTQAWKRDLLARTGIAIPEGVTHVPIDFQAQSLGEGLAAHGFRTDVPAFFSWLGVTMYLADAAVRSTLAWVAQANAPGSGIVFDYVP